MENKPIYKLVYDSPFTVYLLNRLSEYIYIYDDTGHLVFMNSAAENFENVNLKNIIGHHINDDYSQDYSPTLEALRTGKEITDTQNSYIINGRQYTLAVKVFPVYQNEKLIGAYTIQTNVTGLNKMLINDISHQASESNKSKYTFADLIGNDRAFTECISTAEIAARNDSTVLLCGPSGSGKELFAKSIHNASSRSDNPFLAVNCAAVPEALFESIFFGTTKGSFTGAVNKTGIFEQANKGTLFLDEMNSMPLSSQAKLLRVLEEHEFTPLGSSRSIATDVRIISSINVPETEALKNKQIREDLFYRLSVINITLPPLKARKSDISLLSSYFIDRYNRQFGKTVQRLSHDTSEFFLSYDWPGNVRQLRHILESAISLAPADTTEITMNLLPGYMFSKDTNSRIDYFTSSFNECSRMSEQNSTGIISEDNIIINSIKKNEKNEKELIIQTLISTNGNVSKAARILNMHRQSLIYRIKKYGIRVK